jgi:hypothetical protein
MKKGIVVFVLLLAAGFCFAQTDEDYARADFLIRTGLNKNYQAIQEAASSLDTTQRLRLYDAHDMGSDTMWAGVALDFFVGFGIGNFYQKDYLGGGITLGGDLIGMGLIIGGYVVIWDASRNNYLNVMFSQFDKGLSLSIAGGIVYSAFQIFGLVRTFIFPSGYNDKLRNALNIYGLAMNIEPSLDISDKGYELALVRLRF